MMKPVIIVSSLSARRLVEKVNQYTARGWLLRSIRYEPRLLFFARYYAALEPQNDPKLDFVLGPVSQK